MTAPQRALIWRNSDATGMLRAADVEQAYGRERIDRFLALKRRTDPEGMLTSDLWTRALSPRG